MSELMLLVFGLAVPHDKQPVYGTLTDTSVTVGLTPPSGQGITGASPVAGGHPGGQTPTFPRTTLTAACTTNIGCVADLGCAEGSAPYWIVVQASATSTPTITGSECVPDPGPAVPTPGPDPLQAAAGAWRTLQLEPAGAQVSPPSGALVGLPLVLSVVGGTRIDRDLLLGSVPVHLSGTQTLRWTFGDGTTLTTTDRGHPYVRGRPPTDPRFAADYLTHTYDTAGTYRLTLTTTWTDVRATRRDTGASLALPGRAAATVSATVEVREQRTVLVP